MQILVEHGGLEDDTIDDIHTILHPSWLLAEECAPQLEKLVVGSKE